MSRTVKWIIGVFGTLIGLVVVASFLLPLFIDPNDYREAIAGKIQENIGREVSIPGDIKLDISLMGLTTVFSLGEVRLAPGKDFPDTEFFSSRLAEINLALWPLITKKELKINKILLEGVNINLIRNRDGQSNWGGLTGSGTQKPVPEKNEKARGRSPGGLAAIDIGGVQARDINITFVDNQADRTVRLSSFNLDIGHIRTGKLFPVSANFDLFHEDSQKKSVSISVDAKSNFTFFPARQHFIVEGFNFKGLIQGVPASGQELDLEIAADIDLELQQQKIEVQKLDIRQGEMQVKALFSLTGFSNPQLIGSLQIPEFSPRTQLESLGMTLPFEDPESLSRMSGKIDFSGSLNELQIQKIALQLDETKVNGTASVKNIFNPAYTLALSIDQLDMDKYKKVKRQDLTPETNPEASAGSAGEGSTTASSPVQNRDGDQPVIPTEMLKNLTFDAEITVGKLKAARLNIADISLKASGKDGLIRLDPFAADLYEGGIRVTGDIDARRETPEMRLVKDLQGVQVGPLMKDMTGKEEIKGRADIHVELTTSGMSKKDLTRNANGKISLSLADGEIAKLKIIDTIRTAKMLLGGTSGQQGGAPSANTGAGRPTTFAALTATGVITNGVLVNNDLVAESELMKVKGKGTMNLVTEQIDYLLTIYLAKYLERDQESGLVELADSPIPYRIKGTFDKIEQSAALEEILVSEGKKALFKELEKQLGGDKAQEGSKKESSDFTGDLINQGLKSLFGN
jgi:AsmA protein